MLERARGVAPLRVREPLLCCPVDGTSRMLRASQPHIPGRTAYPGPTPSWQIGICCGPDVEVIFLIDTGAHSSSLLSIDMKRLGIDFDAVTAPVGDANGGGGAARSKEEMQLSRCPTMLESFGISRCSCGFFLTRASFHVY